MYSRLIVTGSVAYDEIMDFPGTFKDYFHPEKLHQINVSFSLSGLEKQMGGTATNIAYNASLFKVPVSIRAAIGRDGQEFKEFFERNDIETKKLIVDKKLFTATGKVITDKNDNQIWGFYFGACESAEKLSFRDLKKSDLLIISANHPKAFLNCQKQALRRKLEYIYDPGMALTWIKTKDLFAGIKSCRYLVGNDYEMSMIENRIKRKLSDIRLKDQVFITTLGPKGISCEYDRKVVKVKQFTLKNIVDPTGAGDAWRGGFMASLVKGYELIKALKFANATASFAIEKYGTVSHHPSYKAIEIRARSL